MAAALLESLVYSVMILLNSSMTYLLNDFVYLYHHFVISIFCLL